jgi:hypothetical protein
VLLKFSAKQVLQDQVLLAKCQNNFSLKFGFDLTRHVTKMTAPLVTLHV